MCTAMDVSNEASSEVQPSDVASFAVGDTFSSYDDLKKLAEFEKSVYGVMIYYDYNL